MHDQTIRRAFWVVLLAAPGVLQAQTSYPMIGRVEPTAVQRGHEVTVTIAGKENFQGASDLLFEGTGIEALGVEAGPPDKPTNQITARLQVAENAALGPRELRVVTPRGVSTVGMFVVVADPVVVEDDDKANDAPGAARPVPLPAVISGAIGRTEDVDCYRFALEAGQHVSFFVWANRLENKVHDLQTHFDPILILRDASGRELATDDNALFADPRLTFEVPTTGDYILEVRDTTYAGNADWAYVLQATAGPVAHAVFPMAVARGRPATLHAHGPNLDPNEPLTLDVPTDLPLGLASLPVPTPRGPTPPVPFVITDLATAEETADAKPTGGDPSDAPALPVALSGRLGEDGDIDAYAFEARKGEIFAFEVFARRAGSLADPVLNVLNAEGKSVAQVDDTTGKDPRIEWTAPADGAFAVAVRDLHSRGGTGFGYVLQAERAAPGYTLTCDPDKINIGPGARTALFVAVQRTGGFNGPVTLNWEGLLPGVTASPLTIPANMTQGEIVVGAAPDAPQGAALVRLIGTAQGPSGTLIRLAQPRQEIYIPGGGRGLHDVNTMPLCVTGPSDITVEAAPTEIVLEPGKTATIEVTITRREGFTKPVNLAVNLAHLGRTYGSALPPGVSVREAGSKTLLDEKTTKGTIVLQAKDDAPATDRAPIAVMGHVSINFVVKSAYASAPIWVTVKGK